MASELVVDEVITKGELRGELKRRLAVYETKDKNWPDKKHAVTPV